VVASVAFVVVVEAGGVVVVVVVVVVVGWLSVLAAVCEVGGEGHGEGGERVVADQRDGGRVWSLWGAVWFSRSDCRLGAWLGVGGWECPAGVGWRVTA